MRSNQLSYLAIALKASAKIEHFSKLPKYFATFFQKIYNYFEPQYSTKVQTPTNQSIIIYDQITRDITDTYPYSCVPSA